MSQDLVSLLKQLEQTKTVTETDVQSLRRLVFGDGHVSVLEADSIFRLNGTGVNRAAGWADFFMEAITDFVVRQTLPYGYVDEANAAWLIAHIGADGRVETMTELRTLINILKNARNSTSRLVNFALDQVKLAVINGYGVIGRGRTLQPGVVGEAEVSLLRAVLYACGGEDDFAISRAEADIVFDINDACRGADNHESWTLLFRQAIANHLMYISTHETPARDEALRREKFLMQRDEIRGGFAKLSFSAIKDAFKGVSGDDRQQLEEENWVIQTKVNHAEMITASEAAWLKERIGLNGEYDKNERALMSWLASECPQIHNSLMPLIGAA